MTVVHYEEPGPLPPSRPGDELDVGPRGWVARLRAAAEIAGYIAGTPFVPEALRGKPEEIAAAILYGDEVGLQPMQSLAKIAVIKGRPTLTAEAQRGLIEAAGHELWFEESTSTRAIAAGRRRDSERVGRITWTMDDAKRAGIAGQPNYQRYPAEMLRARASAALARAMFADVIGGMPAAEELEGEPDNGQPVLEAPKPEPAGVTPQPSPPAGRTRRRAKAPAPPPAGASPVTPQPPPDPQPEPPIPPEPLATDAMRRQIFALMRDVGLQTGERDNRLDYTRRIIGRQLESSNELTIGEASRLIDELKAVKELPPEQRAHRLLGEQEQEVVTALADLAQDAGAAPTGETVAGDPDATAGAGDPPPASEDTHSGQRERLDELLHDALEQRLLTIRDLWLQVAAFRHRTADDLLTELGGRDNNGRILWQPLRDNLRDDELGDLVAYLLTNAAPNTTADDDIPF